MDQLRDAESNRLGSRRGIAPALPRARSKAGWSELGGATWTYERVVGLAILASILVRLVCAANTPLAFDEALYWTYSKHLAPGYLDHPGLNPLLIRIGTALFGDTPLGVRFMTVLLGVPASFAIWRAGALLFHDEKIGATAALLFNLTLVMTVGSIIATTDPVVVTTTCFLLLSLVQVNETGRGRWWLAVGAAFGAGMFSKYTTVFFAAGILAWLAIVPDRRRWLLSPWPWAGALIALAIFSPVLIWNAEHHWASAVYQSGRFAVHRWTLRYVGELIAAQIGLATPPIFILGCLGLAAMMRQGPRTGGVLLAAMILPFALYFLWHSLHERVQANWIEPIYPAFILAAAFASHRLNEGNGVSSRLARWSRSAAVPFGLALAGLVYAQAIFGLMPMGRKDPTARMLAAGWRSLAPRIDAIRAKVAAPVVLTSDYTMTGWLSFYLPSRTPVVQINDRIRWIDAPPPDQRLFDGPMLYACRSNCPDLQAIKQRFKTVEFLAVLPRDRGGISIGDYSLYKVTSPTRPVLDPPYPIQRAG